MIEKQIFYSWQSDLNQNFHWKFIEKCLQDSIVDFNKKSKLVTFSLDLATRGLPGSPDIVDSIFKKIQNSSIFIADITPITTFKDKGIPNPNVLVELGFAVNVLGWDNIICINNKSYGRIETLPFDVKQRRITSYQLNKTQDEAKQGEILTNIFSVAIPLIYDRQSEYDEITEIFKLQLDHILLSLTNHFNLIFTIKDSLFGVDVFFDILDQLGKGFSSTQEIIIQETEDFLFYKINELNEITKHPLLILNKKITQITSIMKLIDVLQLLRENILNNRFYERKLKLEKSKVNEPEILNLLLSDVSKAIENIINNWGNHLLANPALIKKTSTSNN